MFPLCTLITVKKQMSRENIFKNYRVENVIKQLVHAVAVRSYEALGKFGEHSRS